MNRRFPSHRRQMIRSLTSRYTAVELKWPCQCTDTMFRRIFGLFGAEDYPLGAVLCSSNRGVRWTAEYLLKRRFIRCWRRILSVSLYDLNVSVRCTADMSIGSSRAEAVEAQLVLLPNPKASDDPLPIPSVHPIVYFEFLYRWIHSAQLEKQVSVHLMLCFEFQLIQFNLFWVFRQFFCFYFASMSTLSHLASKELECAYFHGFWCMVKLLVHEPS
jgi:hypothetical protein